MAINGMPIDFPKVQAWKVRSIDGYFGGVVGDLLAVSTVSGAYVFDAQSADFTFADPEVLEVIDGGLRKLQINVSNRPTNAFVIGDADLDYDLFVMTTDSAVDVTNVKYKRFQHSSERVDLPPMGLCISQRYYDASAAPGAAFQYVHTIFPLTQIAPARTGATQRQHSVTNYRVTPFPVTKDLTGMAFSASVKMKPYNSKLDCYALIAPKPIHIAVYKVADTLAPTFKLPFLPLTTTVTVGDTTNELWRNGVQEAATSVNITTGNVIAAIGAANDILVVIYTTDFVPSP